MSCSSTIPMSQQEKYGAHAKFAIDPNCKNYISMHHSTLLYIFNTSIIFGTPTSDCSRVILIVIVIFGTVRLNLTSLTNTCFYFISLTPPNYVSKSNYNYNQTQNYYHYSTHFFLAYDFYLQRTFSIYSIYTVHKLYNTCFIIQLKIEFNLLERNNVTGS